MKTYHEHNTVHLMAGKKAEAEKLNLISEEPLSIRIQGNPYTVVMRTPGDEIAHVAGFCLGEGLVDSPDDFTTLGYCDSDVNVVTATLSTECRTRVSGLLQRRGFISQTSCGICGKELVNDLRQAIVPVGVGFVINQAFALACLDRLAGYQPLRDITRASHGAALFDSTGHLLSMGEDAGRHNALDKAVGRLFLEKNLGQARILVLSSRASYEMIQKAGRAKIPIVLSISRPTALGVDLAGKLGITLACLDGGKEGLFVFCNDHRINTE